MTTMQIDRAVVEQALEALEQSETFVPYEGFGMARKEAERRHQAAITALRAALGQQANHLTIERLRDALVASRIIDPAAVEDPDGYDDGVTLHRIEALHRRLT